MANKYVIIDDSYSIEGTGSDYSPFTWNQFLVDISGGGPEGLAFDVDYYLSGTRTLTANTPIILSASNRISLQSWSVDNPAIIQTIFDIYFDQFCPNFYLTNLIIQAKMSATNNNLFDDGFRPVAVDYGNVIIDNCIFKIGSNARFANLNSFTVRNSIIIAQNLQGSCSTINGMNANFINTIFDIRNFNATKANNVGTVLVDNCAFTSAVSSFTQDRSSWTNIHSEWTRPDIFSSAVSAINITNDLNYLKSPFSLISATGNRSYTTTWFNGTRDGIGALYFPTISGVAVSGSSALSPLTADVYFVLSGNDPFTVFSASSATYIFGDGSTSSINSNSVLTHKFSENGSYLVQSTILSFNEWYSVIAEPWNIIIGNFSIKIVIYNSKGNNITGGQTKPLNQLTFIASASALPVGSVLWDFGDNLSGTNTVESFYYTVEGTKSIKVSAYAVVSASISATDTANITISATSTEYFVNITSAYDSSLSHSGTLSDPFNWAEFKEMVETSGEYLDTYRLSGSRTISADTSNRYVLNVDRRKNFTIRDWDVSAYGPWVLEVQDFSVLDQNSILSAAGCTLKNGIIYNKRFSSPGYGGQIIIGSVYDMFIVYQGNYSHIIIDPFKNILSANAVVTSAEAKIIGSTIYLSAGSVSAWKDNFNANDYINQGNYNMELTDSVFVNFQKEEETDFQRCSKININNCTFNNSEEEINNI